jgi:RND superfamily putative drug exporter
VFDRLGRFAARYRFFIVGAWAVVALLLTLLTPNIDDVSVHDQRQFLSENTESLAAAEAVRQSFPELYSASSAVCVVDAGAGGSIEEPGTQRFLSQLTEALTGPSAPPNVVRVLSPVNAGEETARALVSHDGQIAVVAVSFDTAATEDETREALATTQMVLNEAPDGTSAYITGDAAIISAYDKAARESVDSTTWLTIVLVIVILLLVYRSPVSPLIPLATITLAYLVSRGVVAVLGNTVMTISGYTNIFIVVILFGAGTDYCLFLISRFREETAADVSVSSAVQKTVRVVGETITSSAGTVVVGLSTMAFAELGFYNTSGPSVAIAVVIALIAGLTLTPAFLALLGRRSFWPRKARAVPEGGHFWGRWAGWVGRHPVLVLVVSVAVLAPLAYYGQGQERNFDLVADLSPVAPARRGFEVLSEHLDPGTVAPLTILVRDPGGMNTAAGLAQLSALQSEVEQVEGVGVVRSFNGALAERGTLVVVNQLGDIVAGLEEGAARFPDAGGAEEGVALDPGEVEAAVTGLVSVARYLAQLALEYPAVLGEEGFRQSVEALATIIQAAGLDMPGLSIDPSTGAGGELDLSTLRDIADGAALPAGLEGFELPDDLEALLPALGSGLVGLSAGLEQLQTAFASRPEALMLPRTYLEQYEGLTHLAAAYFSEDGTAARLSVALAVGPYTGEAMEAVGELRLVAAQQPGTALVEGTSAIMADLRDTSESDMTRAIISVLVGIFLVLIALLRSLVAPIYLILTILLSYAATLGIVRLVFSDILGVEGIVWWVPLFMFVMLVALGMDYNIFLMGRVKEEVAGRGNRAGIPMAVSRTGAIITSAGIIMAGTFAAMISSTLVGLRQIGFAVAVGILLDTFVIRTAVVPAIALLLGRASWWPRRAPGPPGGDEAVAVTLPDAADDEAAVCGRAAAEGADAAGLGEVAADGGADTREETEG